MKNGDIMKFKNDDLAIAKIFLILSCIFTIAACLFNCIEYYHKSYEKGYLDACKDFYKGKLKYDLVNNPDGTRTWKKIK